MRIGRVASLTLSARPFSLPYQNSWKFMFSFILSISQTRPDDMELEVVTLVTSSSCCESTWVAGRAKPRTSGLRAACATPAERGGAVDVPEGPHEVARVSVADPPADLLHGEVRSEQEATRLGHAALRDPLQDGPPRLAPDDGGEVPGREAHRPGHIFEGDRLAVTLLDEAEDLREQGLVLEPEVPHDVRREARHLHEQERKVRQGRLTIAVAPPAQ